MTATCKICGAILSSIPHVSILKPETRQQKEFADLGRLAGEHMAKLHRRTIQTRFLEPDLIGPIPIPALIAAVGFCAQNAAVAAYLNCDDPGFSELVGKLQMIVSQAIEPVAVKEAPALSA